MTSNSRFSRYLRSCKSWWAPACRSHRASTSFLCKTVLPRRSPRCPSPSPSSTSAGCLPAAPKSSTSCGPPWRTGTSSCFLAEAMKVTREFFNLPLEEKQKYSNIVDGEKLGMDGYGNDMVVKENQVLDWNDRLNLLVEPESLRTYRLWPTQPPSFRDILSEYTIKCKAAANLVFRNMAKMLNLQEEHLVNMIGDNSITQAIFNYYPQCPRPDHVLGLKAHIDGSIITVNFADAEGLQLQKNGVWYNVPIVPNALVMNVGDIMEILSNGFFKSLVHRVVTNAEKERLSFVLVYTLELETELEPVSELVDDKRPAQYMKIKLHDYMEKYHDTYATGTLAIDGVKI
ncbi:hypothetical protein CFC21_085168 [Triticum aestivum]|uniref:Fe2OG dioxygenase domain-containing protein n=2 Tax=Triticum aestivum TaxID=4565 RepID=A0A9R1L838_WHEAT|nr:hypothetical protein CFC21_085168 [Triticum aestivum]